MSKSLKVLGHLWAVAGHFVFAKDLALLVFGPTVFLAMLAVIATYAFTPASPVDLLLVGLVVAGVIFFLARHFAPKIVHRHDATVQLRGVQAAGKAGEIIPKVGSEIPHLTLSLEYGQIYEDPRVVAGWFLRTEAHGASPRVQVFLDLGNPGSGFTPQLKYHVNAPWEGGSLEKEKQIMDGTAARAIIYMAKIHNMGITPMAKWTDGSAFHEGHGYSSGVGAQELAAASSYEFGVIVSSDEGVQKFTVAYKGTEIISTSGDAPPIVKRT